MMMKIAVAALAAVAFATSANAAPTENPFVKDMTVLQLQGLDLSTAEGQQRLAIRMDQAARAVCGDRVASVHIALENQARDCRAAVVADIRSRIETRTADNGSIARTQVALAR
jgi:UrcA family protein